MKITIFTSNQDRHIYLVNLMSKICDKLYVIQECKPIVSIKSKNDSNNLSVVKKYFQEVTNAQLSVFGNLKIDKKNKNIKFLTMPLGDLNKCSLNYLKEFLDSDYYIVYGSSFIKGELVDYLIQHKAINIHMGVSPYYKGSACNFWALYDGNPHLVGSTIHFLSKGLDSGPILYHAMSYLKNNPFEYTMSTVKSAFISLCENINNNRIFNIKSETQDKSKLIRYSKKNDFNEEIIKIFYDKLVNLNSKSFNYNDLKNPYFLES